MSSAGGCPSWQAMVSMRTSIVPPGPCPPPADTPGTSPAATTAQATASFQDFAGSLDCSLSVVRLVPLVRLRSGANPLVDLSRSSQPVRVLTETARETTVAIIEITVPVGETDNRGRVVNMRIDLREAGIAHLAVLCFTRPELPARRKSAEPRIGPVNDLGCQPLDWISGRHANDDPMGNAI